MIFRFIALLLFNIQTLADPQLIEAHEDVVAGRQNILTRVDKSVEVTYTYNLVPDSKWHQFPDWRLPSIYP